MELKRFLRGDECGYDYSMHLYQSNFIAAERRDSDTHLAALQNPEFFCCAVYDGDRQIGIAFFWESDSFLYFEHLCIDERLRAQGYGTKTLELLRERGKQIILEIEPAVDEKTTKRKHFYEKNGFFYNDYHHIQPKYRKGDADLVLWIMSDGRKITPDEYAKFNAFLKEKVEVK